MPNYRSPATSHIFTETTQIGKRGVFTIPAPLRKRFGLADGSLVIVEKREDGILLRPVIAPPIEFYSDARTTEFLLSNTVGAAEYETARQEVVAMGLNPDHISHRRPAA